MVDFLCENNQEVVDTVIQAFKIGEDKSVSLPVLINLDGFILSFTREPVQLPQQNKVDKFLPKFKPLTVLDTKKPLTLHTPVMEDYMEFRLQHHKASLNALKISEKVFKEFEKIFGRKYSTVEEYMLEDADVVLISIGALTSTAKATVKDLRSKGRKVGLLKLRMYRPFPREIIKKSLENAKIIGVVDQNISPGFGGVIYPEIKSLFADKIVNSYILGLGGRPVFKQTYEKIIDDLENSLKSKEEKSRFILE